MSKEAIAVTSLAAGYGIETKIDQAVKIHKSWLDIPIDWLSFETSEFIADVTMRDILWPASILIAGIAVYFKYREIKRDAS